VQNAKIGKTAIITHLSKLLMDIKCWIHQSWFGRCHRIRGRHV